MSRANMKWQIGLIALVFAFAGVSRTTSATEAVAAPDHSLTTAEYVARGVPPIDKPWTSAEYLDAEVALQQIAKDDPTQLPRFKSPKSGALFDRMTSSQNLPPVVDRSEIGGRLSAIEPLLNDSVQVFLIYIKASSPTRSFDAEGLELGAFLVRAQIQSVLLIDEAIKENAALATNEKVNAGLRQTKAGLAQSSGGLVQMITDRNTVRTSEATRFGKVLKQLLPDAYSHMLPEGQSALRTTLEKAITGEADPKTKEGMIEIQAALPK
jgi:hypothetical protein